MIRKLLVIIGILILMFILFSSLHIFDREIHFDKNGAVLVGNK